MALIQVILNSQGTASDFKGQCDLSMGGLDAISNFSAYLAGLVGGSNPLANFEFQVGGTQAAGSLVVAAGGSVAGQACTIGNVTFTGRAANPAANEFVVSATAATQAANMVAAINASENLTGKVVASTVTAGTVTLTAVEPGVDGNAIQLSAGNLANVTANAFTGGADGTSYDIDLR